MNLINFFKYKSLKKESQKHYSNLDFDMTTCDKKISKFADSIYRFNRKKFFKFNGFSSDIGFFATELYDAGGHTPCLVNLIDSMFEDKKLPLFISKLHTTKKYAPKTLESLERTCFIEGFGNKNSDFTKTLIEAYNKVIQNCPKIVFLYIHPVDVLMTSLIHLLKKNAGVKFVFFNHASHYPNLAMTMADLIIECLSFSAKNLTEKRKVTVPYKIFGLQSKKKDEVKYYTKEEISNKRKEFNVSDTDLLTVSGANSYKYFNETNTKSEHFEMIKRILEKTPNLKHLVISNINSAQEAVIEEIFKDSPEIRKNLLIHPMTSEYQILFQCADLFIDSFPVSSAMAQIDLMSMKVPTVVKINLENTDWTFHEYMPENYPYMFEKVEDMEKGILYLLSDEKERKKVAQSNYEHWLNHNESDAVKEKYLEIFNSLNTDVELINFLEIPYETQLETRNWRNSEKVAKWFKISYIDEKTHINWLESLKKDSPSNIAFGIKYNGIFIGVTYFHSIDYDKKEADWGIYIYNENMRGLGIGSKVLEETIKYAFNNLKLNRIYLDVNLLNEIAKKIYISKGFRSFSENNGFLRMVLTKDKKI